MTKDELRELFKTGDEYLKFERVKNPRSNRPDLHAMLLLDSLVPGEFDRDLIGFANHDIFYVDIPIEEIAAVITPEQVVELIRCGVHYSTQDGDHSLAFYT